MSTLADATSPELLFPDLDARDGDSLLEELARRIAAAVPGLAETMIARGFRHREALGSTALGGGLAVPHCKVDGIGRAYLAVGISRAGIEFGAADHRPVHVFFAVLSPLRAPGLHLKLLAGISRWARTPDRLDALLGSADREGLLVALDGAVVP